MDKEKEYVYLMNNLFLRKQTEFIYEMCKKDAEYNLAHYTSLNAICNIIENGELWFRNPNCMNDSNEITTGKEVILSTIKNEKLRFYSRLKAIFDKLNINESFMQTKEKFYAYIESELNNYTSNLQKKIYICCLTKHIEREQGRLSMWRSYGLPANAAVVFSPKFVQSIVNKKILKKDFLYIAPVIYGLDKYYDILDEILNLLETNWTKFIDLDKNDGENAITRALKHTLVIHLMIIKNEGFAEENEVRLIMISPDNDKHLKKDMKVINNIPQIIYKLYIDDDEYAPIECSWLKEILVGPTNFYDTIKEALIFQIQKRNNTLAEKYLEENNKELLEEYYQKYKTNSSTSRYEELIRKTDIPLRTSF